MWLEYIVLFSIAATVFSIMIVLMIETVHTTKSITRKRNNSKITAKSSKL